VRLAEFAGRCGGALFGEDAEISGFATDSREVKAGDLFLCIRGERVDGHEFAVQAFAKGAVACLCERKVSGAHILVDNIASALAAFALTRRKEFSGPVVGITGSTGKTTTKEFVAAALSPLGPVLKSAGNRNTEYTSPLVWAELTSVHRSVVVEMGMRGFGQIDHLASFSLPTIGVVTNIGTSHMEKVGSREGIVRAKGEMLQLLPRDGAAILWQEDLYLESLKSLCPCESYTFGFSQEADCQVLGYRALTWERCLVRGQLDDVVFEYELPTVGRHQALNSAAAVLAARCAGSSVSAAAAALPSADVPPLRLQVVSFNGATVVLDTYNASPDSMVAALKTLTDVPARGRRIAILGEMKELGDYTESGHREVGAALGLSAVDIAVLTGGPTAFIRDEALRAGFPASRLTSFETFDIESVRMFLATVRAGDVVLIKGSRALGLESALEAVHP
jgi:UDP-N-acetylmuramoyl-tripeptide--D-alanyl-D-alanine ligase